MSQALELSPDEMPGPLGGTFYVDVLREIHEKLKPTSYFEIGTLNGETLKLARCKSVAVDPAFQIQSDVIGEKPACNLYQSTSDAFFARNDVEKILGERIAFAFLDGMHLFEFLLRDFINTEKHCWPNSIIALHDCVPLNAEMASRERIMDGPDERYRNWWTGDVWKVVRILRAYRPDLRVAVFDAPPTGLVLVTGLDPTSDVLGRAYPEIIRQYRDLSLTDAEIPALHREFTLLPTWNVSTFLGR